MELTDSINELFEWFRSLVNSNVGQVFVWAVFWLGSVLVLFYALDLLLRLIKCLRLYVFSQYCCKGVNFVEKYGQWAVISGATDGIGQAMAKELAKRGMSIIVMGRNDEKLARTKSMLELVPNVGRVETIKADLSDWSPKTYDKIRDKIEPDKRDIGVLINNAGVCCDSFIPLVSHDPSFMQKIINVNTVAPVHLSRMILPGMEARRKGLVINVSSMVGSLVGAYIGVYAPTKAFVNSFTRQLQFEHKASPIDIVLLTTGPVMTNIFGPLRKREPNWFIPTADSYAESAINALSSGIKEYSGSLSHAITIMIVNILNCLGLQDACIKAMRRSGEKYAESAEQQQQH